MTSTPLSEERFLELLDIRLKPLSEERFIELIDIKLNLSEERFIELIDKKLNLSEERILGVLDKKLNLSQERILGVLDKKLNLSQERILGVLDIKLKPIYETLKKLEGFQDNESSAIEFELEMLLQKHLKNEYPLMSIRQFPIKSINDPFTNEKITEFDAAFLLLPLKHHFNYSRLKEAGLPIPKKEIDVKGEENIFILAEAKHFLDDKKIKYKLHQFDRINKIFKIAKMIKNSDNPQTIYDELKLHPTFLRVLEYNGFFSSIKESILFFGASYWEKNLLQKLESDIEKRETLINKFYSESQESPKKLDLYKKICTIESNWYNPNEQPNSPHLENNKIMELKEIPGAMGYLKFIHPSGERFKISGHIEPAGTTTSTIGGHSKTKTKKKEDNT